MENINFNDIRRLWNLKLVVETGSIKKAATRANVTSSAMSQSISVLEESVGSKLLIRGKDNLLPTEYASELLRSAQSAFSLCLDVQRGLSGGCRVVPKLAWLDLATTECLAIDLLPEAMKRLKHQFPNLRLKLKTGDSFELTKAVKNAELCMAVVEENDQIENVTAIIVAEERLGLYCSAKIPKEDRDFELVRSLGLASRSWPKDGHPSYFSKFVKALGAGLKPTLTSASYEVLCSAAVNGAAVAILPSRVANRHKSDLAEIPVNLPKTPLKKTQPGQYGLYLVCEPGCSSEESEFLASEMKSILGTAH